MICRTLYFSDLQQLPVDEQALAYAEAYLNSAEVLCISLCSNKQHVNYAYGSVVMSLAFHSLELFFKGCILKSSPTEQFWGKMGHDLDQLSENFFKLYPEKEFQFEIPFRHEIPEMVGGVTADELTKLLADIDKYKEKCPEDQRHRYPTSIRNETWKGAFSFEPNSFLVTLRELQQTYSRIRVLL